MIAKLQYISQGTTSQEHLDFVTKMCIGGIKWVQLRLKSMAYTEMFSVAMKCRELTNEYQVKLIINDHIDLAVECQADGIHLGKEDKSRILARKALKNKLIGATANTLEDICRIHSEAVADYIGLGPLRYTNTKEQLSPVLGFEAYAEILIEVAKLKIDIPILAIGGVSLDDIQKLKSFGLYGVAVSSALSHHPEPMKFIQETNKILR